VIKLSIESLNRYMIIKGGKAVEKELPKNLIKKLSKIQIKYKIERDKEIKTSKGSYVTFSEPAVMAKWVEIEKEYNLFDYIESIEPIISGCSDRAVTAIYHCILVDLETFETLQFCGVGSGWDQTDKQAGKSMTYGYKNAILKLIKAVTGEDSDNDGTEQTISSLSKSAKEALNDAWSKSYFHAMYASLPKDEADAAAKMAYREESKRIAAAGPDELARIIQALKIAISGR
jgi:hypothetical protein